jgi:hypothetical protein
MCYRQGLGGPSVRANIVSAVLISGRVSADVGRVGMAEQDVGVGLVRSSSSSPSTLSSWAWNTSTSGYRFCSCITATSGVALTPVR